MNCFGEQESYPILLKPLNTILRNKPEVSDPWSLKLSAGEITIVL